MFILATMLIAVYVIAMTTVLINYGGTQTEVDREGLLEPYWDVKRELQQFLELILAEYTIDGSLPTNTTAIAGIETFLSDFEDLNSVRGVHTTLQLNYNTFRLRAQQSPYSNVSDGQVYISEVFAEFGLEMRSMFPSVNVVEAFNISFVARVEIQGNIVFVQQSSGMQFIFQDINSMYILNGSTPIVPISDSDHSGIYRFPSISNLDNLGILNVTFPNGVRVLS